MTTDNRTNEVSKIRQNDAKHFAYTPEQVEAAAEGMWDRYGDRGMFQHVAEHLRSAFRKDARAALVAAASAAPVQPSSTVDEDALAEVIAKSRGLGNGWAQIPPLTREAYREIARAVSAYLRGES